MKTATLVLVLFLSASLVQAQSSVKGELWGGYITSFRLNDRWSVWNDFHYIPSAFWVNRHGLTYQIGNHSRLTAGYAFLLTGTSFTENLQRKEHRPWWQYEVAKPVGTKHGWRARVRYDRRIRQNLGDGEFAEGWTGYNRWRLMLSARMKLAGYENGHSLHLHLLNEILVNTGEQYFGNWLDQNRTYLMVSYELKDVRIQFGPHLRAIPSSSDFFNYRYGLTCWVIQRFDKKLWPLP